MCMKLKTNQHKRISFNTITMSSLSFLGPPKILGPLLIKFSFHPNLIFCSGPPAQLFWSKIFRSPLKLKGGGGCYHDFKSTLLYFLFSLNTFLLLSLSLLISGLHLDLVCASSVVLFLVSSLLYIYYSCSL